MSVNENKTLISQLFNQFIEGGGEPKVTSFKRHLDQLINNEIKQLCVRSGKSTSESGWRSEIKEKFSGKGARWVMVSLDEISPTISRLESEGVECDTYRSLIESKGAAWIRFAGARVANEKRCAAFEVRTGGSKVDHPKQLHYIDLEVLDETIQFMSGTPHSLKFEEIATGDKVEVKTDVKDQVTMKDVVGGSIVKESDISCFDQEEEVYEDMMGDIESLMALENEAL